MIRRYLNEEGSGAGNGNAGVGRVAEHAGNGNGNANTTVSMKMKSNDHVNCGDAVVEMSDLYRGEDGSSEHERENERENERDDNQQAATRSESMMVMNSKRFGRTFSRKNLSTLSSRAAPAILPKVKIMLTLWQIVGGLSSALDISFPESVSCFQRCKFSGTHCCFLSMSIRRKWSQEARLF